MVGIQQASQQTGVTAHTLRYYERIGLIVDVPRDGIGHRQYGERDLRWVTFLTKLRLTGMPIQDMLTYARLMREGPDTADERAALLESHRQAVVQRMNELQGHLDVIHRKIEMYRSGELT